MAELIISLVPLALVATFQPPQLISFLFLLQTQNGAKNALAYIAGMSTFRLALGAVFWVLVSKLETSVESSGGEFSILVGTMLAILGLLMLVNALRKVFSAQDEDQVAASWLDKLDSVSFLQSFLVGLAFLALDPKDWITDIAAVNLIADADLSETTSFWAYITYPDGPIVALGPLDLDSHPPRQAQRSLAGLNTWMKQQNRIII